MLKKNYKEVENIQATLSDGTPVENVNVRWLINTERDGAQNFAMRRFEIKPNIKVPLHNHPQEHEIYILSGNGKFNNEKGQEEVVADGDFLYITPFEKHAIENTGKDDLVFLCMIPYLKKKEISFPDE